MTEPRTSPDPTPDPAPDRTLRSLGRTLWLTRAGMAAERAARAFWPIWSLAFMVLGLLAFGVQDALPIRWAGGVVLALALAALWYGARRFRWPSRQEARDRLDRTLPERPLTALADHQTIGAGDAASRAVWRAHLARMAKRAAEARPVHPDLRLAGRDRFALRYVALTAFVMALVFGSVGRMGSVTDALPGGGALAAGPSWEGWIEPPRHTGLPTLYLNEITAPEISAPEGSRVTLRLYGEVGALSVEETVSAPSPVAQAPAADAPAPGSGDAAPAAADPMAREFRVARAGALRILGPGGRDWRIEIIADAPPTIAFAGDMQREAGGRAKQDFTATDDYGVTSAQAEIVLDLPSVDRRHGLAAAPEPRPALVVDLPLSMSGPRTEIEQSLIDDFSQHPWANLPVRITLRATDANGATGTAERADVTLPGRRFFDPLAAAVIEMRRDLLWSRDNARRASQILRAVTHLPEGFIRNEGAYLQLRVVMRRLDSARNAEGGFAAEERDEIAAALWEIAVQIEDGDLASALERLRRAQDRLSEAMRNGADESEIAELMQELREAMQDYMRQLAENAQRNPDQQQAQNQNSMEITGDQLQQMLQRLQELMEQGRMAEAAELLEQLRQMMENMQVTQGEGQGQQGPGQQAMRDLADALRQQQGLSDEAFRDLQDQFGQGAPRPDERPMPGQPGQPGQGQPGARRGEEGQQGQPGQAQPGQPGQQPGPDGDPGQSLADRQEALREQLRRLQEQGLPFPGTEEGDAARRGLDDAGRAMEGAEDALRGDDLAGALDRQSEAMEALRDSLRNLGDALARNQQEGQGQQGRNFGNADPRNQQDPLGRSTGRLGRLGTDERLLQGEDVYRRAEELLEELRRRSGDQSRPQEELDYLRRLLDRF